MAYLIACGLALSGLWVYRRQRHQSRRTCATGYFGVDEFEDLNSGLYHDTRHPVMVAELLDQMAQGWGIGETRRQFLVEVALIHDADPRRLECGTVQRGTPARVPVTLAWMEDNLELLERKFGWTHQNVKEAMALIARTDFPFCPEVERSFGTRFDELDPVATYRLLLEELAPDRRAQVMVEALLLRFADQMAYYVGSFGEAAESLCRLASEFHNAGRPVGLGCMWNQTVDFLNTVGTDLEHDHQVASRVGLDGLALPDRGELLGCLSRRQRRNLHHNIGRFQSSQSVGWRLSGKALTRR